MLGSQPEWQGSLGLCVPVSPLDRQRVAPARHIWQTPDSPVVAELARLAVGEEEVVGEED